MLELLSVQVLVNAIQLSLLYILVSIGLVLIFGFMRVVNFAHGDLYMLGAFAAFYIVEVFHPLPNQVLNFGIAIIVGPLLVGLLGFLMEKAIFHPLRGKEIQGLVVSVALGMLIQSTGWVVFGTRPRVVSKIVPGSVSVFGATITNERLVTIFACAIILLLFYYLNYFTKIGRAIRAVEQDPDIARTQGINVDSVYSFGFALSAGLAAIAGVLVSPVFIFDPAFGGPVIMKAFVIVGIGGMRSVPGCILAGFILGFVDSFVATLIGPEFAYGIGFLILLVIIILKPKGLLGH